MQALDYRALKCPLPLIKVKQWLASADLGKTVTVLLSDPGSRQDIPRYLDKKGYQFQFLSEQGSHLTLELTNAKDVQRSFPTAHIKQGNS